MSAPAPAVVDALTATPQTTSTVAGVLLPLLVGLATHRGWPPAARGLLLASFALAVSASTVVLERATADAGVVLGPVPWGAILDGAFTTWVAAQTAHEGVWRKTGVLAWLQARWAPRDPGPAAVRRTIDRAQGTTTASSSSSARAAVRPRPPARPRDPERAARAEQRVRMTRPEPTGRHAFRDGRDDDGPPTRQER